MTDRCHHSCAAPLSVELLPHAQFLHRLRIPVFFIVCFALCAPCHPPHAFTCSGDNTVALRKATCMHAGGYATKKAPLFPQDSACAHTDQSGPHTGGLKTGEAPVTVCCTLHSCSAPRRTARTPNLLVWPCPSPTCTVACDHLSFDTLLSVALFCLNSTIPRPLHLCFTVNTCAACPNFSELFSLASPSLALCLRLDTHPFYFR